MANCQPNLSKNRGKKEILSCNLLNSCDRNEMVWTVEIRFIKVELLSFHLIHLLGHTCSLVKRGLQITPPKQFRMYITASSDFTFLLKYFFYSDPSVSPTICPTKDPSTHPTDAPTLYPTNPTFHPTGRYFTNMICTLHNAYGAGESVT